MSQITQPQDIDWTNVDWQSIPAKRRDRAEYYAILQAIREISIDIEWDVDDFVQVNQYPPNRQHIVHYLEAWRIQCWGMDGSPDDTPERLKLYKRALRIATTWTPPGGDAQ